MTNNALRGGKTNVQKAALVFGALFLLIGVLGFIPGITGNYDNLTFAGHVAEGHNAALLGIFEVSVLHNIVHLLFGAFLLAASRRVDSARKALLTSGVVYAVLFVLGLFLAAGDNHTGASNFVPVNGADNVLHALLAVGLVASALLLTKRRGEAGDNELGRSEYL